MKTKLQFEATDRNKKTSRKALLLAICIIGLLIHIQGISIGQTPFLMSSGNYLQNFSDITAWSNNFTAGNGASNFRVATSVGTSSVINSAVFVSGASGGIQKGTGNIVILATGTNSAAFDLLLDLTNRIAGTISLDFAKIVNTASTRTSDLKVQYSTDNGLSFTDLTGYTYPRITNDATIESGSLSNIPLPAALNNQSMAVIRFYVWNNSQTGGSGNRPKFSLDNFSITSISSLPTVTVSPISDFGNQCLNTISPEKSYTVLGSKLTNNIAIVPPAGFEISTVTGAGFIATNPLILSKNSSGDVALTSIYIRFKPALEQVYTGNISHTSAGSNNPDVIAKGTGINAPPSVSTLATVSDPSTNSVTCQATIANTGCQTITARGICYGANLNPDINGDYTTEAGTTGTFSSSISNLETCTQYYFRGYVTTNEGTVYGTNQTFTTQPLSAPVATEASNIQTTGFTANWDAVTGATAYQLDVSEYPDFAVDNVATDLILSEYVKGSSYNKYIEIYNGTGADVDLSDYKIQLFTNGSATVSNEMSLSGILPNKTTIVYKHSSAIAYSGISIDNTAVNFNGDDALAIYKISTSSYVDIFGRIGEDPGTAWTKGGISTLDKTLVRKSTIAGGVTINPDTGFPTLETEWDMYNRDDVNHLGAHIFSIGSSPSFLSGWENVLVSGTNQKTVDANIVPNSTYYYRVKSVTANCSSIPSNIKSITTPGPPSFVATFPKAIDITGHSAKINVQLNKKGNVYFIYNSTGVIPSKTEAKAATTITITSVNSTFASPIVSLVANTTYTVYMYAQDDAPIPHEQANLTHLIFTTNNNTTPIAILEEDFESGNFGNWTAVNITSNKDWNIKNIASQGAISTDFYARLNASQENTRSQDWFISPEVIMDNYTDQKMTFYSRWSNGISTDELSFKYTLNYTGNPLTTSWINLPFTKPTIPNVWSTSGNINISAIQGDKVRFAFQYYSSGSPSDWDIDQISLTGLQNNEAPQNFRAAAVNFSQIQLDWQLNNDNNDVIIAYNTTKNFENLTNGHVYLVNDIMANGAKIIYTGNLTTFLQRNLQPGTSHYYKAWSIFDGNSYSNGVIANASTIDPATIIFNENFENGGFGDWTAISLAGNKDWKNTNINGGANATTMYCEQTVSQSDIQCDDWLISPEVNLNNYKDEVLIFFTQWNLGNLDNELKLKYTTNFSNNPATTIWTEIPFAKSISPENWSGSGNIDVSSIQGNAVRFAFHYLSNSIPRIWRIDEIMLKGTIDIENPSSLNATGFSQNEIDINWQKNDNNNHVLLAFNTTNSFGIPVNQTTYTSGNPLPGGGSVLYNGALTSFQHTGLTSGSLYYYKVWSILPGTNYSSGLSSHGTTLKPEPSNHVTNLQAISNYESIQISWTDAIGLIKPDGYLIKALQVQGVTNPVDGTPINDDFNLTDGQIQVNITAGVQRFTFTGLTSGTYYHFYIFPYSNSENLIDYKTDGTIPYISLQTVANPTVDYYASILPSYTGQTLKNALNDLISVQKKFTYDDLWNIIRDTDEDPANPTNVILMHTGTSVSKSGFPLWNIDHIWATSHGDFGTTSGAGTDVHNIRPVDPAINSLPSNLDYDEGGTLIFGTTDCYKDNNSFEPADDEKGDIARMIFYMAVRYEGENGEPDLEINNLSNKGLTPFFGYLNTLLKWHRQDPVSDFERQRNDRIFKNWQQNRNPFIDHPEWVTKIWNDGIPYLYNVFVENVTGSSFDIKFNSNENGTVYLVILPSTLSAPSDTEIMSGLGALGEIPKDVTNQQVIANTQYYKHFSGLTNGKSYKAYLVCEDNLLNLSEVKSVEFITNSSAPHLTRLAMENISGTTADAKIYSSKTGTAWYVLLKRNARQPTSNDMKNGTGLYGTPAIKSGNLPITATIGKTFNISGISSQTDYSIYLMADDGLNNNSNISVLWFSTSDITSPILSEIKIQNIIQSSVELLATSSEIGIGYYIVLPNGSLAPTKQQIKAGRDAANNPVGLNGSWNITAGQGMVFPYSIYISGLSSETRYTIYLTAEDGSNNLASVKSISFESADVTPPVISNPAVIGVFENTVKITVTSNESGKIYGIILPPDAPAPNNEHVKAGQNALSFDTPFKGNQSVIMNIPVTFRIAGLTHLAPYTLYLVAEDGNRNLSGITYIDFFMVDLTPPELSNISVKNYGGTNATCGFTSNENGIAYYVICPKTEPAPDKSQVKAGTGASGIPVMASFKGTINVTTQMKSSFSVSSGLISGNEYLAYIVAQDNSTNLSLPYTIYIDCKPPVISETTFSSIKGSTASLQGKSNETGKIYYIVLPVNSPVPSQKEIKVGTGSTGIEPISKGNISVSANSPFTINLNGMVWQTNYSVYMIAEDEQENLSFVNSLSFTTTLDDPPMLNSDKTLNDGLNDIEVTFPVEPNWQSRIYQIFLDGVDVSGKFTISNQIIHFDKVLFATLKSYSIVVKSFGYLNTTLTQNIIEFKNQSIIFANLSEKTYGDPAFSVYANSNSGLPVIITSSNPDVVLLRGSTLTIKNAGQSIITVQQQGAEGWYAAPTVTQILKVIPKNLTAQIKDASRLYGVENPAFEIEYSGFVLNDNASSISQPAISSVATKKSPVGVYETTAKGGYAKNYNIIIQNGKLTITKRELVARSGATSRIYGEKNPAVQIQYEGFINNDDKTSISEPVANCMANEKSNIGEYPILLTGGNGGNNYKLTLYTGILTIKRKNLYAKVDAKKVYGEPNPVFEVFYDGFVNGDTKLNITEPATTCTATVHSEVGTYPVLIYGGSAKNYTLVINKGILTIEKKVLTVSVKDAEKNYGNKNPSFSIVYTGFLNGDTKSKITVAEISTTVNASSPAGEYKINATGGSAINYIFQYIPGTLLINKRSLTVQPVNISKLYGEAIPELGIKYSGFVNNDSQADITPPSVSSDATISSPVGLYDITIAGGEASNYYFSYKKGTLTIQKRTLKAIVQNVSKVYGSPNPEFKIDYEGFVNGDPLLSIAEPIANCKALQYSKTGDYSITLSGGESTNYAFSFQNGILRILKKQLLITADDKTRNYLEANPQFTISYSGFAGTENELDLNSRPSILCQATTSSPAGTYQIVVSGGSALNYNLMYHHGTLTISQVKPFVTTASYAYVGSTKFTSGGTVTDNGGAQVTERGICWSITAPPTLINDQTMSGAGTGSFTNQITGLLPNTTYYISAFATNVIGTTYGNQITIKTAPVNLIISQQSITENNSPNQLIGSFTTQNADNETNFVYSLVSGAGDKDNSSFTISNNELETNISFDYETKNAFHIRVKTDNHLGISIEKEFEINVLNVNEHPTGMALSAEPIGENTPTGKVIGTFSATGADKPDTRIYQLIKGNGKNDADNDKFTIKGNNLIAKGPYNFENHSLLTINVQVKDNADLVFIKSFTIKITDENDAPMDISLSNNSIREDAKTGSFIGQLTAEDEDTSDSHTFGLMSGNEYFAIEENRLLLKSPMDYEIRPIYKIQIKVMDKAGEEFVKEFFINVADVNEPPYSIGLLTDQFARVNTQFTYIIPKDVFSDPDMNEMLMYQVAFSNMEWMDWISFNPYIRMFTGTPTNAGKVAVTVTALDKGGLSVAQSFMLTIDQEIQNPVTGIEKYESTDCSVFPNPSHGFITVMLKNVKTPAEIQILDITGRVLTTHNTNSTETQFDLQMFGSGVYFVRMNTAGRKIMKKVIVK